MNDPLVYYETILSNKYQESLLIKSFDIKELDGMKIPKNHFIPLILAIPSGLKVKQNTSISSTGEQTLWINLVDKDY
jgi:hypothetical protein